MKMMTYAALKYPLKGHFLMLVLQVSTDKGKIDSGRWDSIKKTQKKDILRERKKNWEGDGGAWETSGFLGWGPDGLDKVCPPYFSLCQQQNPFRGWEWKWEKGHEPVVWSQQKCIIAKTEKIKQNEEDREKDQGDPKKKKLWGRGNSLKHLILSW